MSAWSDTLTNAASLAIAGTAAAGVLGWIGRKLWKGLGRIRRFLDDYEGTPARRGVQARPGVMERLQSGDARFDVIDEKMDTLDAKVDGKIDSLEAKVDDLSHRLDQVAHELPRNGVPLAAKIDALYQAFIINQAGPS